MEYHSVRPSLKKPGKQTVWQCCYSEEDFDRLGRVMAAHGQEAVAEAVRFCLLRQYERDQSAGLDAESIRLCAEGERRCEELRKWRRANQHGDSSRAARDANTERPRLKRWSCLLSSADLDRVDGIASRHGFLRRSEAVRFAVFVQSSLDGYQPREDS